MTKLDALNLAERLLCSVLNRDEAMYHESCKYCTMTILPQALSHKADKYIKGIPVVLHCNIDELMKDAAQAIKKMADGMVEND